MSLDEAKFDEAKFVADCQLLCDLLDQYPIHKWQMSADDAYGPVVIVDPMREALRKIASITLPIKTRTIRSRRRLANAIEIARAALAKAEA